MKMKKVINIGVVLIIIITASTFAVDSYKEYKFNEHIEQAESYLNDDNFKQAIYRYEYALKIKNENEVVEMYNHTKKLEDISDLYVKVLSSSDKYDEEYIIEGLKLCESLQSESSNHLISKHTKRYIDEFQKRIEYNKGYDDSYNKGYNDKAYKNSYEKYRFEDEITYEIGCYNGYRNGFMKKSQDILDKKKSSNSNSNGSSRSDDPYDDYNESSNVYDENDTKSYYYNDIDRYGNDFARDVW